MTGLTPADAGYGVHMALLYSGMDDFLAVVTQFVKGALSEHEPVLAAVPARKLGILRDHLGAPGRQVSWTDLTLIGANPARIIPAIRAFVSNNGSKSAVCVHEPVWESRTEAERLETIRHDALINLAFTTDRLTIVCPYDLQRLGPGGVATVERTHPVLIRDGKLQHSGGYDAAAPVPEECDWPLQPPPDTAVTMTYQSDLVAVRSFTAWHASHCGLSQQRGRDLVLAVSELAANTLRYGGGRGVLTIWPAGPELICQVEDAGHISDLLVGRHHSAPDVPGGHGMWVVQQICDLVELRSSPKGTTIRLHMRLDR
jgi:anti-sigma regulatory factor (Ser/Thr protein kinase)